MQTQRRRVQPQNAFFLRGAAAHFDTGFVAFAAGQYFGKRSVHMRIAADVGQTHHRTLSQMQQRARGVINQQHVGIAPGDHQAFGNRSHNRTQQIFIAPGFGQRVAQPLVAFFAFVQQMHLLPHNIAGNENRDDADDDGRDEMRGDDSHAREQQRFGRFIQRKKRDHRERGQNDLLPLNRHTKETV